MSIQLVIECVAILGQTPTSGPAASRSATAGWASPDVIIQLLSALFTFLAIVVALFPAFFQRIIAREYVRIVPQNLGGTIPKTAKGSPVVYFHLKVHSRKSWLPVNNCHVMLKKVQRLNPATSAFEDIHLHVPLQFVWSPANRPERLRTLVQEEVFDFLRINQPTAGQSPRISPVLYEYTTDNDVSLGAGETVRYHLGVVGNEFASLRPQVWEVSWDGVWTENQREIAQHVRIREIPSS